MPSFSQKGWLWIVLAVALGLRGAWALGLQTWLDARPGRMFLIEGDANGYWHLAEDIAAGREYAIYEPPRRVLRMPAFPALLALPMRMFDSPILPARLLLAVVGTGACGLVYLLGRLLFDPGVGLTAAGLAAVSPTLVGFTPLILSETLFAACLLASLVAMAWIVRGRPAAAQTPGVSTTIPRSGGNPVESGAHPSRPIETPGVFSAAAEKRTHGTWPVGLGAIAIGLFVGALIGAACYVRPSWLLSAPVFGGAYVALSAEKGRAVIVALCVVAGAVGVLLPWGMRNQRVTGHFVLTTLWMGPSLYDGLNPQATGDSDMAFFDRDNLMGQDISEYEVNRHYTRKAWAFVRANPGRALKLAAIKLWRYFKPWPNAEQFGGAGPAVLIAAFTIPMFVLAARGWWTVRGDIWGWGLTVGTLLYFAALHMVFVSSLRYRLPAEYALLVMTAVGWRSMRGATRLVPQTAM